MGGVERTKKLVSGLRAATVAVFFAAALLSTGCSNNALMNPQMPSSSQGVQTAQPVGGGELNPVGGGELNP